MISKVVFIAFVGLLAVDVSIQSSLQDISVKGLVGLIAEIVLDSFTHSLNVADIVVDALNDNHESIRDKMVEQAVKSGKKLDSIIFKFIDGLADGATEDGKAVLKCIDAEQNKSEAAIARIVSAVGVCVDKDAVKVMQEVEVILNELRDFKDNVQTETKILESCTDGDSPCLKEFIKNLGQVAKNFSVTDDIKKIMDIIEIIMDDSKNCTISIQKEIKAATLEIFSDVVVCIRS